MANIVTVGTAPEFWNVTFDVFPNPNVVTTDVMLVQALLVGYFTAPFGARNPHLKTKAMTILSRIGKRFDDGIYGDNTREVMSLFEEDMGSPFRDGIVRTVPFREVGEAPETKLKRLNFIWNTNMLGGALGETKFETGKRTLQPVLFRDLYTHRAWRIGPDEL